MVLSLGRGSRAFGCYPVEGYKKLKPGFTLVALAAAFLAGAPAEREPAELLGLWRGTSQCTDRVAAPACHDEEVVYTFTAGIAPGAVRWKADKIVDGTREPMGDDLDVAWNTGEGCWKAEFANARVHVVWCFRVTAGELHGSAWLLPGKQTVRRVDARRLTSPAGGPPR